MSDCSLTICTFEGFDISSFLKGLFFSFYYAGLIYEAEMFNGVL